MDWAKGYVTDIGYTAGFYRETAPAHMAFAALTLGRSPGRALTPKLVLELGCGQGFGLALLAAANPDVAFEGYDFNPEHVAHARALANGAALSNVRVTETSFEDAAAREAANDADVIALHGIFSWVARGTQDAIVSILRQRLQPNGLAYVSYNCMPGWAPLAPIRQLMMQVKRRNPGRSERQLALALDLIGKLRQGNAAYFAASPAAAQHLDAMGKLNRVYLAHEYLDEHWELLQFSDAAARFGGAKLSYVCSATLTENLDQYAVPQDLQALVAETDDPILKETIRDFAANKRFRRDLYARGSALLTPAEHLRTLAGTKFALAVPSKSAMLRFAGPLMELTGREELYRPLLDTLGEKNASFEDLLALPAFGKDKANVLLDCLALLVHSGQVLPLLAPAADADAAHRFNRMIVDHARGGRIYSHLASPVARTGVPVSDFGLLTLAAIYDGKAEDVASVARHAMGILKILGRRPMKEGRLVEDDGEATIFLAESMQPILHDTVPVWRRLGVL
jgi:SAM-dependent methyltransferase